MINTFFQDLFKDSEEVMVLKQNGIHNIYNVQKVAEMVDRHDFVDEDIKEMFSQMKSLGKDYFKSFKYMVELYIQTENFKRKAVV